MKDIKNKIKIEKEKAKLKNKQKNLITKPKTPKVPKVPKVPKATTKNLKSKLINEYYDEHNTQLSPLSSAHLNLFLANSGSIVNC